MVSVCRRLAVFLILLAMNAGMAGYANARDCQRHDGSSHVVVAMSVAVTPQLCCTAVACSICAPMPSNSVLPVLAAGAGQVLHETPEIARPSLASKPDDPPPRSA